MIEKNWLDLKKPDELEIKQSEYNPSQAVIEVGPFERGFGAVSYTHLTLPTNREV